MFSDNGRISKRQLYRLFVFNLAGVSTLILPSKLAASSGLSGFLSIIIGGGIAGLYLWYLLKVMPYLVGKRFAALFLFVTLAGMAGYDAYLFADVMQYALLPEESYTVILVVILALSGYMVFGGIESLARAFEVLFGVIFILLLIMLLVAARGVEVQNLSGAGDISLQMASGGSLSVFLCYFSVFLILFMSEDVSENAVEPALKALCCAVFVTLLIYAVLVGNFGVGALSSMDYPVVILMSSIPLKGSFLKRLDAFMAGIWFFALFAQLSACIFYGKEMLFRMCKSKKAAVPAMLLSVFVMAEMFCYGEYRDYFESYMKCLAVPLLVVLPGLMALIGKAVKKR